MDLEVAESLGRRVKSHLSIRTPVMMSVKFVPDVLAFLCDPRSALAWRLFRNYHWLQWPGESARLTSWARLRAMLAGRAKAVGIQLSGGPKSLLSESHCSGASKPAMMVTW